VPTADVSALRGMTPATPNSSQLACELSSLFPSRAIGARPGG
jgi:hypothetical protein